MNSNWLWTPFGVLGQTLQYSLSISLNQVIHASEYLARSWVGLSLKYSW